MRCSGRAGPVAYTFTPSPHTQTELPPIWVRQSWSYCNQVFRKEGGLGEEGGGFPQPRGRMAVVPLADPQAGPLEADRLTSAGRHQSAAPRQLIACGDIVPWDRTLSAIITVDPSHQLFIINFPSRAYGVEKKKRGGATNNKGEGTTGKITQQGPFV